MRRILLIDDSRSVRRSLESCLDPYGFELEEAENGAVALARLKQSRFDLVFLDVHMPVLDGPSLLRIMRQEKLEPKVVLITSGAETSVLTSIIKLGASDFVSKPFEAGQVRAAVCRSLGMDPSSLSAERPCLLLQCAEAGAARSLEMLLPSHVAIDAVPSAAAGLELARRKDYQVALVGQDHPGALDAVEALRAARPYAGLFLLGSPDETPDGMRRVARGPCDGVLPWPLDEGVARDFLYSNYLRRLVFVERSRLTAAGFRGNDEDLPSYFRQLGRVLQAKADAQTGDASCIAIDLRRVPPNPDLLARLVGEVHAHFQQLEVDLLFTVTGAVKRLLSERPEAAGAVLSTDP